MRIKLSRLGLALLVVLAGFVVLAFVGSGTAQTVGFAGAVVVAIVLVGGVPFRGASDGYGITSTERGKTITYAAPQVLDEAPVDEQAWRRERERREQSHEEQPGAARPEPAGAERLNPFGAEDSR